MIAAKLAGTLGVALTEDLEDRRMLQLRLSHFAGQIRFDTNVCFDRIAQIRGNFRQAPAIRARNQAHMILAVQFGTSRKIVRSFGFRLRMLFRKTVLSPGKSKRQV